METNQRNFSDRSSEKEISDQGGNKSHVRIDSKGEKVTGEL